MEIINNIWLLLIPLLGYLGFRYINLKKRAKTSELVEQVLRIEQEKEQAKQRETELLEKANDFQKAKDNFNNKYKHLLDNKPGAGDDSD